VDFSRDFFGKPCGLTVSGQLNGECFALAFGKVYTFGPTFRAENSHTARHAAEFWMIEPEIAFAGLTENMELCEEFVRYLINDLFDRAPEELAFFEKWVDSGIIARLENVRANAFERCTYSVSSQ
jgi:asparaginyl-tRNA synthetase